MFVNASQLSINLPPLNRSNSLPVLDMATASQPVPLLQPLNVPRYMPHSMSNTRMTPMDAHPPQAQVPSMPMQKNMYEWPGPGPRIASLLPPEHLGTPLAGQLSLTDDMGYTQIGAYPYAQQNFWIGGTDQNTEMNFGINDEKVMNPEMMRRRHVCPVCDKRFNRPSSLATHMAVHTGAKPFVCQVQDCGRRFSVSSNLRRHEKTHNVRGKDEDSQYTAHSSSEQTPRPSYMTHGQSASIPNYQTPTHAGNEYRPSSSYSETHTRKPSYPPVNTPYQTYSYPVPQHPHHQDQHQHQPFQYQSQISLPQPLPSASIDISEFFHAMPPSASGPGMNLENYQVVSGAKSARGHGAAGMSRGSSSSESAGMVETPQHEFDADGEEDGEEVMDIVVGEGK